ncbi:hypothetical protein ACKKBF_B34565 [Auxenochlorella protothecoides x Auxenochlorella symbiontica]
MADGGWFERVLATVFADTPFLKGGSADYVLAACLALCFPIVRAIMDRTVHETVACWALKVPAYKKSDDRPKELEETKTKFKESLYKAEAQAVLTFFLLLVVTHHKWAFDTRLFWSECYQLPCLAPISLGERFIYCLELGFYLQALPILFVWETKRKDRLEVAAHHVATILLIAYSYYLNLTRVGIMVLACHELNDVFLESAKMARYARHETSTTVFFATFALSWFVSRIYVFPVYVIRSTLIDAKHYGRVFDVNIEPHYSILNGFLIFLLVLHMYWSYLIVRIIVGQLRHGEIQDVREEEEAAAAGGPAAHTRHAEEVAAKLVDQTLAGSRGNEPNVTSIPGST